MTSRFISSAPARRTVVKAAAAPALAGIGAVDDPERSITGRAPPAHLLEPLAELTGLPKEGLAVNVDQGDGHTDDRRELPAHRTASGTQRVERVYQPVLRGLREGLFSAMIPSVNGRSHGYGGWRVPAIESGHTTRLPPLDHYVDVSNSGRRRRFSSRCAELPHG